MVLEPMTPNNNWILYSLFLPNAIESNSAPIICMDFTKSYEWYWWWYINEPYTMPFFFGFPYWLYWNTPFKLCYWNTPFKLCYKLFWLLVWPNSKVLTDKMSSIYSTYPKCNLQVLFIILFCYKKRLEYEEINDTAS